LVIPANSNRRRHGKPLRVCHGESYSPRLGNPLRVSLVHGDLVLHHIPPERLVISSDCGMGREGMSRRHAQYKMVAMVLGTNIVRQELGIAEAECLAADPRYSLASGVS